MKLNPTRDQLVKMYIDSLQQDQIPWRKAWSAEELQNPISKTTYRGVNKMLLWWISDLRGLKDPRFATFNQIQDLKQTLHPGQKWHLKEGSHGIPIELWKIRKKDTKELIDFDEYAKIVRADPDQKKNYVLWCYTYRVFSFEDIEGVPALVMKQSKTVPIPLLQEFCEEVNENMGVKVEHSGNIAFYSPSSHSITLPPFETFDTAEDYYATRLHETAHSTGAKDAMNRSTIGSGYFLDNRTRAAEELYAEIASSFIFAELKMPADAATLDNHKAYIQSWIDVLQKDPQALFSAIKEADRICDYVLDHGRTALGKIREAEAAKDPEEDFITQRIQQDYEQQMISEEEYQCLGRHVSWMSEKMKDQEKENGDPGMDDIYQSLRESVLQVSGFHAVPMLSELDRNAGLSLEK